MNYKHFFAALAAAFLLCVGSITAQTKTDTFSNEYIINLMEKDTNQLLTIIQQNKLNLAQIQLVLKKQRFDDYLLEWNNLLVASYWQQLKPNEKLAYPHMRFVIQNLIIFDENKDSLVLNKYFHHFIDNRKQIKKLWGDSLYNEFVFDNLTRASYKLQKLEFDCQQEQLLAYKQSIKKWFPRLAEQVYLSVLIDCMEDHYIEEDKKLAIRIKYINQFVTDPIALSNSAFYLANKHNSPEYNKIALKWVKKAIKVDNQLFYSLDKAYIFCKLGKKRKARRLLERLRVCIPTENKQINDYYNQIWDIADKKK